MEFYNSKLSDRVFMIILCALLIFGIATLFIDPNEYENLYIYLPVALVCLVICMYIIIFAFGTYKFDDSGVLFKCLLFKKQYKWEDFKFIGRYSLGGRRISYNGVVFSVSIEKDDFKKSYLYRDFSKKFFTIPASDELLNLIIKHSPYGYLQLLVDEDNDINIFGK